MPLIFLNSNLKDYSLQILKICFIGFKLFRGIKDNIKDIKNVFL